MFTGIIQSVGRVERVDHRSDSSLLHIDTGFPDLELGESVAVNGVCLTVAERGALFFVSPETLALTNLGSLQAGTGVNLERAVTLSTRLSGHLVQGHVDGMARLLKIQDAAEGCHELTVAIPHRLARYCVNKGSITVDGISLTLNRVRDLTASQGHAEFMEADLMIIPHTWKNTQLGARRVGDLLNIEVDLMAKYAERLMHLSHASPSEGAPHA